MIIVLWGKYTEYNIDDDDEFENKYLKKDVDGYQSWLMSFLKIEFKCLHEHTSLPKGLLQETSIDAQIK